MNSKTSVSRRKLSLSRALVACLIGALAGLGPSPAIGPGLWICLVLVFLLVRAPLLATLGVGLLAKLLALVAMPLTYQLGAMLLDGPTEGLFKTAINTPFLALFGLEYYTVTGGLCLGLVLGLVLTPLVLRAYVRTVEGRRPGLVRPVGVLLALLACGGFWLLQTSAAQSILTSETASALTQLNGATVDVSGVNLDLADSKLEIDDMAFANPRSLSTNLFQGRTLTADLASSDLLRKRVHIEKLIIGKAESGSSRAVPGVLLGAPSEPEVEPPAEGERGIEDYLKDWEVWKERLGQAREWIEKMSKDETAEVPVEDAPLDSLIASQLIDEAPSLLVSELAVEDMSFDWLSGEVLTLSAKNLSTQPSLVEAAMGLSLTTKSDLFHMDFALPSGDDPGRLSFALRGLPVDSVTNMLKLGKGSSLAGGTLDLALDGPWSGGKAGTIDLPLEIKLNDIQLALRGSASFPISELVLPVHLKGPIDRPNVRIDPSALTESLRAAGAKQLLDFVETKKAELLDEGKQRLNEELGGKLGELLGQDVELDPADLAGTQAKLEAAAKAKLEQEAKQAATEKAAELLGDKAQPLLDALEGADSEELKKSALEQGAEAAKEEGKKALGKGLQKLFGGKQKPD